MNYREVNQKDVFAAGRVLITFRGREEQNGQLDIELKINDFDVVVRSISQLDAIKLRDFLNRHYTQFLRSK